jgi:hypothetical protein
MTHRLTKKDFIAWLRSKHPQTKVAPDYYGCTNCPLANYLTQTTGVAYEVFDSGVYAPIISGNIKALPAWALRFVECVDSVHNSVSAAKALEILRDV